jgi:hypothetical protein
MTSKVHSLETGLGQAALCASLLLLPLVTGVACAPKSTKTLAVTDEITTAATHAGIAAKSTTIDAVHKHMHHALNCLVGPDGEGFDPDALNPCKEMGHGGIADASDPAQQKQLESVADTLRAGLKDDVLASARDTAAAAEAALIKAVTK